MKTTNECRAEYVDHMGDDLRVVNAARVSFDKESDYIYEDREEVDIEARRVMSWKEPVGITEKDKKLIAYLARHGHWTPFSHVQITLRETVPIFIARQRFKHMVGFTYNEVSRRYVDDEPEFFVPDEWRGRPKNAKQGSDGNVKFSTTHYPGDGACKADEWYEYLVEEADALYGALLSEGVAPEQARMVLPQSMMTSYYVTGSLAAWARAYNLRVDSHAQKEIQDLAKKWDEVIAPICPVSWKALVGDHE